MGLGPPEKLCSKLTAEENLSCAIANEGPLGTVVEFWSAFARGQTGRFLLWPIALIYGRISPEQ